MSAYDQIVSWFAAAPISPTIEWAHVEPQLGTALPADYKRLCNRFPPCWFEHFKLIHPLSLFGTPLEVTATLQWQLGFSADALAEDPSAPDPDHLIAWGSIDGDPYYCWDTSTSDNPDEWSSLIMESHGRYQYLTGTTTTCLRDLITGEQVSMIGPPIVEEHQLVMSILPKLSIPAANWTQNDRTDEQPHHPDLPPWRSRRTRVNPRYAALASADHQRFDGSFERRRSGILT